jgi:hypothetical protein
MPGWLDEEDELELLKRIEARRPDAIVLFSRETKEYGVEPLGKGYGRLLAGWIARNYTPVETMRAGAVFRPLALPRSR